MPGACPALGARAFACSIKGVTPFWGPCRLWLGVPVRPHGAAGEGRQACGNTLVRTLALLCKHRVSLGLTFRHQGMVKQLHMSQPGGPQGPSCTEERGPESRASEACSAVVDQNRADLRCSRSVKRAKWSSLRTPQAFKRLRGSRYPAPGLVLCACPTAINTLAPSSTPTHLCSRKSSAPESGTPHWHAARGSAATPGL